MSRARLSVVLSLLAPLRYHPPYIHPATTAAAPSTRTPLNL